MRIAAVRVKVAGIALSTVFVCLSLANLRAEAAVITIPQSALVPSTQYYTDIIGGGIGSVVVMTGGGNAANVGLASGRNDDGFSGPIPLGFTLSFFGNSYTTFFANNNGNISFGQVSPSSHPVALKAQVSRSSLPSSLTSTPGAPSVV